MKLAITTWNVGSKFRSQWNWLFIIMGCVIFLWSINPISNWLFVVSNAFLINFLFLPAWAHSTLHNAMRETSHINMMPQWLEIAFDMSLFFSVYKHIVYYWFKFIIAYFINIVTFIRIPGYILQIKTTSSWVTIVGLTLFALKPN